MARRKERRKREHPPHPVRPDPGAPPGTVVVDPAAPRPRIRTFLYDAETLKERTDVPPSDLPDREPGKVLWVDVVGLGDAAILHALAERYGLHPLAVADVAHADQRPKAEDYGQHVYIVLRDPRPDNGLDLEQMSVFVFEGLVLTFQEREGDPFDAIRERIRENRGRVRRCGADYLAYCLVDAVVDFLVPIIEGIQDHLYDLEDELLAGRPRPDFMPRLVDLRKDIQRLRGLVFPTRDMTRALFSGAFAMFTADTMTFLRDCNDHLSRAADQLDAAVDHAVSLASFHQAVMNQRGNEAMRLLTIIATIFIPLSFVAGVYGMNFKTERSPWNMPELEWVYGYPFALGVMASIALALLVWFRRKGWLGGSP